MLYTTNRLAPDLTDWKAIGPEFAVFLVVALFGAGAPVVGQLGAGILGGFVAGYLAGGGLISGAWHGLLAGSSPACSSPS